MPEVVRFVTVVDVGDGGADARHMSVSARHDAILADGRRIALLHRGWGEALRVAAEPTARGDRAPDHALDVWATTTVADVEETARVVVGPDEPPDGRTQDDVEAEHSAYLGELLREHGVETDARELERLPHDVVLSESLRVRLAR
jgi:hypothetical protein